MASSVQQTDTAAAAGAIAACHPGTAANAVVAKDASVGGTAGSVNQTVTPDASGVNRRTAHWEWDVPAGYTWSAGTWTVRLNVVTANTNLTWVSCWICQINSANVNVATVGSNTAVGVALGTTGVKSTTVTGSLITPSSGDKLYIVLGMTNALMSAASLVYLSDQLVDSPFTAGGGGGPVDEDYEYVGGGYYPVAA